MKILLACEESQAVTIEMRKLGHEAYSCDIQDQSGGHPEWHIKEDVTQVLQEPWDMVIAFPPCTHLANSGARWFKEKQADGRQQMGIDFFMMFTDLPHVAKVVIENPIGIMSTHYRKPDQIIQPYWFGDPVQKSTCLWLKGLPLLDPTNMVDKEPDVMLPNGKLVSKWNYDTFRISAKIRGKVRSKTFPGIAKAMAMQWGK